MSRLLDNSNRIRQELDSRKLYTPENPYDANASNTVETINNISNIISPFTSFDLSNTIVGRLIGNNTPLARIGLQMLAKQFAASAQSNAVAEYLPTIDFGNLFDGDPNTKLITLKQDFQITRRELQSNVGKILEEISGRYPQKGNPFNDNSTNNDYIINTGKGQLSKFVDQLNRNKYKPSSTSFIDTLDSEGFQYGNIEASNNKSYFLGNDTAFHPYNQYKSSNNINDISTLNNILNFEINNYRNNNNNFEYGSNQDYVNALGVTSKIKNIFQEDGFFNYGLVDSNDSKLTWGRDGATNFYKNTVKGFDDPIEGVEPSSNGNFINKNNDFDFGDNSSRFNLEAGGLLSYTRELLNSRGKYSTFDQTRKKFIDTNEDVHYNGSPLSLHVDGATIDKNRQHSVVDPYNKFVKAIRYNGNKIYNGNENSVIYDTVIPNITPKRGVNDNVLNKNLMFSIENLAVLVNSDEITKNAFIDDFFRTTIPYCEKGPNNGRLMWFPPYDINLSENVVVDRTKTNFIGRGEPIYTYNNTERIGNLSFKLIIDYPPQVRGLNHVEASRFFAFGGNLVAPTSNLDDKIKRRDDLIKQRNEIQPKQELAKEPLPSAERNFYFANDEPKVGGEANSINFHLNDLFYEIDSPNKKFPTNDTLNENFKNDIDRLINEYLVDDSGEKLETIEIELTGSASKLFNAQNNLSLSERRVNAINYNLRLSKRRVDAIKFYIESKYKELTGKELKPVEKSIFIFNLNGQVDDDDTDEASEISNIPSKIARRTNIIFRDNGVEKYKDVELSDAEKEDKAELDNEIEALNSDILKQQTRNATLTGCEFNTYTINDGILKGFNSTENIKYKPAFHSQTPEDFHRRLTFLHQCTRQGSAVRKFRGENGETFSASNSVFGRQPVQVLRIGDFFHTKIIIDSMQIDYSDAPWDTNPEGMGMQFMIADVKLQIKILGGQSLKTPISMLQNAVSFNYYANSTFYNDGVYKTATNMERLQEIENSGVVNSSSDVSNPNSNDSSAQNNKTNNKPSQ